MTKKGYSEDPAWKPLTDADDNADEDGAGGVHVKTATLRPGAEAFLTKRLTIGKKMSYDGTSLPHCAINRTIIVHNGRSYKKYVCRTHSVICSKMRCVAKRSFIPDLGETYTSGCNCKEY